MVIHAEPLGAGLRVKPIASGGNAPTEICAFVTVVASVTVGEFSLPDIATMFAVGPRQNIPTRPRLAGGDLAKAGTLKRCSAKHEQPTVPRQLPE